MEMEMDMKSKMKSKMKSGMMDMDMDMDDEMCDDDKSKPSEAQVLKVLLTNYRDARSAKEPINRNITKWLDIYKGKLYGNEVDARSKVVVRDVYKTIESMKPNISEPFIGSPKPVDGIPYTAAGELSAIASEKLLNHNFTTQIDRRSFVNTLADVLAREGTVWVKNEWKYEDEEFRTPMTLPADMLHMITDEYEVKKENKDGSVDIEIIQIEVVKNEGDFKICRNEHVFTDPTAECDEDMQFLMYQYDAVVGDLDASGLYKNLDKVGDKLDTLQDQSLGSARDQDAYDFGRRYDFKFSDKARKKTTLVEYWGNFDINGDGIAIPILAVWDKQSETMIRFEENPMPDGEIPFERCVYIEEPFSLWGKALADPMADGQRIHTAFMRGFIDNAALANNGQKFIMKGGMDQQNFRRMVNGEKHIYMNKPPQEVMQDGSYNEMPSSVTNIYEMVEAQNEGITGISRINQGLDAGAMAQTAAGVSALTSMSQRRLLDTVRNVSNLLRKLLRRNLAYSLEFLEEEDWMRITGMQKPQGKLGKDFDIKIELITDAQRQSKISQYLQMFQNLQYVSEDMQFETSNALLAKYYDIMDEPMLAEKIKNQEPPQPDPAQVRLQELEMQKLEAEAQEKLASAQLKAAQAQKALAEAQGVGTETQGNMQAKQQEMQMKVMESQMQVQLDRDRAMGAMALDESKSDNDMELEMARARLEMLISRQKAEQELQIAKAKAAADIAVKRETAKVANDAKKDTAKPKE